MRSGQWFIDGIGARWYFDSGALCLDFAYTGDFGYDNPAWERLRTPADLKAWLVERHGPLSTDAEADELSGAKELRSAITRIARAHADGAAPDPEQIDVLNSWAARPDIAPALGGGTVTPVQASTAQALATIARDAVDVFSRDSDRIRRCASQDCDLVFFDGSRPNSRRWCSMQHCGNRAKVRAHRQRAAVRPKVRPEGLEPPTTWV
ncbi:MAG: zf-CGNR multi-domain protein [Candidatus Leucobacter sulfamidivorax]|nr:zf-CGNR multi-domain protein [Candidatus Leucobacter sulfamidivorax]